MNAPTHAEFLEDAYRRSCEAEIISISEQGGIILDRTVFYATSGGQPGDSGWLEFNDGSKIEIATAVKDKASGGIALVPSQEDMEKAKKLAVPGTSLTCHINWERRYKLMQMHTACHLLSVILKHGTDQPAPFSCLFEEQFSVDARKHTNELPQTFISFLKKGC